MVARSPTPPGRYRIIGWQHGEFEARLNGWFEVPPRGRWTLHDELAEVAARFHEKFPAIGAAVTRSLITTTASSGVSASP